MLLSKREFQNFAFILCTLIYVIVNLNYTISQHCYFKTPIFSKGVTCHVPLRQSQSTKRHLILISSVFRFVNVEIVIYKAIAYFFYEFLVQNVGVAS